MILLRNVASTAHKRVHTRAIVRSDQGSKKLDRFCLKRGLVELFFFCFRKMFLPRVSARDGQINVQIERDSLRMKIKIFLSEGQIICSSMLKELSIFVANIDIERCSTGSVRM